MRRFCLVAILSMSYTALGFEQMIEVTRPLDFGTVAIIDNSSLGEMIIDQYGNMSRSMHFAAIKLGHPGEVSLSGFLGNQKIYINSSVVQATSYSKDSSLSSFVLKDLNHPPHIYIQGNGTATFGFGGTLQNSGDLSAPYSDTDYYIDITIILSF